MRLVSIIYTQFDSPDLDPVLMALQNQHLTNASLDIVVIENGPDETQSDKFRQKYPNLDVIHLDKYIGSSRGINLGIEKALTKQPDYLWISDPFIIPDSDMFVKLVEAGEKYRDSLLFTPKIYQGGTERVLNSAGYTMDWTTLAPVARGSGEADSHIYSRDVEIDYIPVNQLFAKPKSFLEFGYFDNRLFEYYFDTAFYQKIRSHGYHHNYISQASAVQIGHPAPLTRTAATYYQLRDQLFFSLLSAPPTTRLSSIIKAVRKYLKGNPWERRAVLDLFSGNLGPGSYQWE